MNQSGRGRRVAVGLLLLGGIAIGCGSGPASQPGNTSATGGASAASSGGSAAITPGTGGATTPAGSGGSVSSSGGATGGTSSTGGTVAMTGGISGTGGDMRIDAGAGGSVAGSGGLGATGGASGGAAATGGKGGSTTPSNCNLPATVGFQADVQPFLITTCGNGGGSGCHVVDASATTGTGTGNKNHAYDWITAGAHASSCPEKPTPKRFEVVMATINGANPPTCSKSRKMPPPDATGTGKRTALTACQIAALQAWLDEPMVTQMHRADDSSPTTPYPMPPFN